MEGRAFAGGGFDGGVAAEFVDDATYERQAESEPVEPASVAGVGLVEVAEDGVGPIRVEADAAVVDGQGDGVVVVCEAGKETPMR